MADFAFLHNYLVSLANYQDQDYASILDKHVDRHKERLGAMGVPPEQVLDCFVCHSWESDVMVPPVDFWYLAASRLFLFRVTRPAVPTGTRQTDQTEMLVLPLRSISAVRVERDHRDRPTKIALLSEAGLWEIKQIPNLDWTRMSDRLEPFANSLVSHLA